MKDLNSDEPGDRVPTEANLDIHHQNMAPDQPQSEASMTIDDALTALKITQADLMEPYQKAKEIGYRMIEQIHIATALVPCEGSPEWDILVKHCKNRHDVKKAKKWKPEGQPVYKLFTTILFGVEKDRSLKHNINRVLEAAEQMDVRREPGELRAWLKKNKGIEGVMALLAQAKHDGAHDPRSSRAVEAQVAMSYLTEMPTDELVVDDIPVTNLGNGIGVCFYREKLVGEADASAWRPIRLAGEVDKKAILAAYRGYLNGQNAELKRIVELKRDWYRMLRQEYYKRRQKNKSGKGYEEFDDWMYSHESEYHDKKPPEIRDFMRAA